MNNNFLKSEGNILFLVKMIALGLIIFLCFEVFQKNYFIGIDTQVEKCIPGYSIYLVDKKDRSMKRGEIYAFRAKGMSPLFKDGQFMAKYLRGLPGDEVEITENFSVNINGETYGEGLPLLGKLSNEYIAHKFVGKKTIEAGYWVMGVGQISFDSRYWGLIAEEQIIGRAIPII